MNDSQQIKFGDFGSDELNNIYNGLDLKTKNEIDAIQNLNVDKNKKTKIINTLLKDIDDENVKEVYNNLPQKEKDKLDALKIREKIGFLKQLAKTKIVTKEKPLIEEKIIGPRTPDFSPPTSEERQAPEELLKEDINIDIEFGNDNDNEKMVLQKVDLTDLKQSQKNSQKDFTNLMKLYYQSSPYSLTNKNHELEVRFGTRGIKPLNKNDYDSVIKKLKSLGFISLNEVGTSSLKIQCEYLDKNTGKFKLSNTRITINDLFVIQKYCKTNDLKNIYNNHANAVTFVNKNNVFIDNKKIFPVNFDDFNFRVSYQIEENINMSSKNFVIQNWEKSKKIFRYLNRVTFTHPDYPINVDISITKFNGDMYKKSYTVEESNVFNSPEKIEIELEVDNNKIGPYTKFDSYEKILEALRKVIKFVLSGLQHTNFPVSYSEQKEVMSEYMKILHKENYNPEKKIYPSDFIGPSSFTLQMSNIAEVDVNSNVPNIRKNFVVTDKADGERNLLFICSKGKIYLINTNMQVIFTGAKTIEKEVFNTLLDGELIANDKFGKFINLYACFDIYYLNKVDVRMLPFMIKEENSGDGDNEGEIKQRKKGILHNKNINSDLYQSRYMLLKNTIHLLKPMSIMDVTINVETSKNSSELKKILSPLHIKSKKFYPESVSKGNIFNACNYILNKIKENRFEYKTDGLIFTHAYYGVGSNKEGETGPLSKITWDYSFKWKPAEDNTIDFFVVTLKQLGGEDVVKTIFEEGLNSKLSNQLSEYKTIQLSCTYSEKRHGVIYLNPCQDIIDDKLPEFKNVNYEDKYVNDAKPMQFYPTEPFDPEAGLCNIMLKIDDNGVKQMFTEENEVFGDNMIVEFSYDLIREKGWRWIPKRVRYDKTSEFLQGMKNFGNAYHVANSNWKTINNPITEEMISTGQGIPDITVDEDIYYNKPAGKTYTEAMKNFHNLHVKKLLIKSVSKQGNTLIDYACGKAGDLPKWISARLSFVFGIDKSKNNIEDRLDGACVRYLNSKKTNKHMPYALFVNGDSSFNIKSGSAMLSDKAIQVTKAIFGNGPKEPEIIGKGVAKHYGKGEDGFDISSCQFAIHYFLENPNTLQGFMKNIAECTKLNGYFIGTCYDGKEVFNLLRKKNMGDTIQIVEKGKKVWEIIKGYSSTTFDDNSSCIGYRIDVYQDSINQLISEYLVNFDYLDRVFDNYGFKLIDREEAQEKGLPEGSGLFSELYMNMLEEVKKNKNKANDYGEAINMTDYEKKISFLNRYFVYKKIRNVNTDKVQMEFGDYNYSEMENNNKETQEAVAVSKEFEQLTKKKMKVRNLQKKIVLTPATEAMDEYYENENKITNNLEETKTHKKLKKNTPNLDNKKKLLIIEEDENQ